MCGRYAITMPPEAVREWFRTYGEIPNWPVYYNAASTRRRQTGKFRRLEIAQRQVEMVEPRQADQRAEIAVDRLGRRQVPSFEPRPSPTLDFRLVLVQRS
jgi:hypothetical protein